MESVSLILIVVGVAIIAAVLLLRLSLRNRNRDGAERSPTPAVNKEPLFSEPEFDPLFAIGALKDEVGDSAVTRVGKIVAAQEQPRVDLPPSVAKAIAHAKSPESPRKPLIKRSPPRVADDPRRVVALNVMAGQGRAFPGGAVRNAVEGAGFEYGDWQIFHYYSHTDGAAPPLFSLANMVKPGNFDLERMDGLSTVGLSLFMVPSGEDDIAAFDTMLVTARRLAEELGGEVRDARRSVLTRQAIVHIREQLNEWRCRAQAAQH